MGFRQVSQYVDVTVQPLYDTATQISGATTTLAFFQTPVGAPGGNFAAAAAAKTLADTTLDLAGQLPSGQNFAILGFRVQPHFAMNQVDSVRWSSGAWFVFTVGQKPYLRVPVDTLPAGVGTSGFSTQLAAGAVTANLAHGLPSLSNAFTIGRKPLELSSTTNFSGVINWVAAQTITSTAAIQPAAGLVIRTYLDGFFYRAVQ